MALRENQGFPDVVALIVNYTTLCHKSPSELSRTDAVPKTVLNRTSKALGSVVVNGEDADSGEAVRAGRGLA